jgi:sugar phosphate permease
MDAFSYGIAGSIIYGMWVRQFGYSSGDIGVIVGTLSVSTVVCQYPATKFLRMVGTRRCLAFSEFLTVVVMIGWATTGSLLVFILLSLVFGVSIATWVPALQSFLMTNAPPEERGSVGGKLAAVRGLIASPAPIIGSLLFNSYGYYLPVTLGLIGEAFTTLAILRLLPKTNGQ